MAWASIISTWDRCYPCPDLVVLGVVLLNCGGPRTLMTYWRQIYTQSQSTGNLVSGTLRALFYMIHMFKTWLQMDKLTLMTNQKGKNIWEKLYIGLHFHWVMKAGVGQLSCPGSHSLCWPRSAVAPASCRCALIGPCTPHLLLWRWGEGDCRSPPGPQASKLLSPIIWMCMSPPIHVLKS